MRIVYSYAIRVSSGTCPPYSKRGQDSPGDLYLHVDTVAVRSTLYIHHINMRAAMRRKVKNGAQRAVRISGFRDAGHAPDLDEVVERARRGGTVVIEPVGKKLR